MIHLSSSAASEINRLRAKHQQAQSYFRIGVQSGGCADLTYTMEFKSEVSSSDLVYDCNGIQVLVDKMQLSYLENLTLDYSEDLMGGGFRFHNPNAQQTCGCGHSFSVDINPLKSI